MCMNNMMTGYAPAMLGRRYAKMECRRRNLPLVAAEVLWPRSRGLLGLHQR